MAVTCNLEKNVASNLTDLYKSHSLEAVYRVSEAHLQVREIRTKKRSKGYSVWHSWSTPPPLPYWGRMDIVNSNSLITSSCNKAGTDIVQMQTAVTVYFSSKQLLL